MYILILILLSLVYVYGKIMKKYTFWNDRKVPNVKPHFFFGNYKDCLLRRKTVGEVYMEVCNRLPNARYVGVYRLLKPELIVQDPDQIKHVLVSNFQCYKDRQHAISQNSDSLSLNLFHLKYDAWKVTRQKVSPAFSTGKLRNMFNLILEVGNEFNRYLETIADGKKPLEFQELMAKFMTDVIGSCVFGIKMNAMSDEDTPFRLMGRDIFKIDTWKFIKYNIRSTLPAVFKFFNLKTLNPNTEAFFRKVIKDIVQERDSSGIKRQDFIDIILELRQKDIDNKEENNNEVQVKIDERFIAAQAFSFFTAGYESSSTLMSFTLHELALNNDIQDNVYAEISSVLEKHGGKLTYESVSEMDYLEMVLDEAQRKYPAVGVLMRRCTKTDVIPASDYEESIKIDEGTSMIIPVLGLHYNPEYYPNPEEFIPERFSSEVVRDRHPMVYLPFGAGPRNCIGLRFGKLQSKVGIINLLKDFYVKPCSKTVQKVKFCPISVVTKSKDGIWLSLHKRQK